MDLGLKGKVALVTAASKGMGKACALGLAAEGARVAMCARTEADLKVTADEIRAQTKAEVLAMPTDVTKTDQVRALVARVKQTFGSAGHPDRQLRRAARAATSTSSTTRRGRRAVEVSLLSTVRLIREVLPGMRAKRWGRILTIQSVSVKQPLPELLLSNAVRPGVHGHDEDAGRPARRATDILVNTLCPGRIVTDRLLGGLKGSGALARGVPGAAVGRTSRWDASGTVGGVRERRRVPGLRARLVRDRRRRCRWTAVWCAVCCSPCWALRGAISRFLAESGFFLAAGAGVLLPGLRGARCCCSAPPRSASCCRARQAAQEVGRTS